MRALLAIHAPGAPLTAAIGADRKGKASVLAYAAAIPLAFASCWIALAIYVAVAVAWFVPDLRIERTLERLTRPDRASG
jgi:ABC-type uncharacterized transport system YnjBCD permease subunit